MDKRKICFVIPEYNYKTSTHFAYLYDFVELLSREYDIFLVAEKGNGKVSGAIDYYIQKWRFLPFRIMENLFVLLWARYRGYSNFYVHYSFLSAFQASLISRLSGGITWYWNCGLPWLYKRNWFRQGFEKLVYRLISFLVTGTDNLGSEYARHYKIPISKIITLPNWIDIQKIKNQKSKIKIDEFKNQLKIPPNAKVLLFVHRLSKRKGADHLPEILNQLKNDNVFLLVVGDGPEREALNVKLKTYNLQDKVKFVGWVPQSEVANYFMLADIFLLPSEEEGFPHVLLEAMAPGTLFVASGVGGIPEIIPSAEKNFLVSPRNTKEFADRIRELLVLDESKRNNLKLSLLEWVSRFDIKNAANRFRKIIEDPLDAVAGEG